MSVEENKALAKAFIEDYPKIAQGDMALLHHYFADDFVNHTPLVHDPTAEGRKQGVAEEAQAFSAGLYQQGFSAQADWVIGEGDLVVAHWTARGVHHGQSQYRHVAALPPTQQEVTLSGLVALRVQNGKFTERWNYENITDTMIAQGVIQATVRNAGEQ
jgi:predicted ester cyclase